MRTFTESLLAYPGVYRWFRKLTGSEHVNREFVERYVRPRDGEAILDVGCGPGDVVELMPRVEYVGVDVSEKYIALARHRFGGRATFLCGDLKNIDRERFPHFDVVMAMGILHHLDDQSLTSVLRTIRQLIKPGGRFVSYDPCFTEPQHPFARWIHRHDRGQFVRFEQEYDRLIASTFKRYRREIRTDLCTVPATVVIFQCESSS